MERLIAFSESSLRYFMFTLGHHVLQEYMENMPDHEDELVLEALIEREIYRIYRSTGQSHSSKEDVPYEEPMDFESE